MNDIKNVGIYKKKRKLRTAEDFSNAKDLNLSKEDFQLEYNEYGKELLKISQNINVSFADRKVMTNEVSTIMNLYDSERALKIRSCGNFVMFENGLITKKYKVKFANFCRERLCPMCQWRKSRRLYSEVCEVTDYLKTKGNYEYIFLTLTVKNVKGNELINSIDNLFKSWTKLSRRKVFKDSILGYFRNLEVTYNLKRDDYHPHFHVLMIVDKNYFCGKRYIKQSEWQKLWQDCANLDYKPQVNIKKVTQTEHRKDVSEVAKYTIKASDFILTDIHKSAEVLQTMQIALKGRRLTTFSGLFKKALNELKFEENIDKADLTDNGIVEIVNEPVATLVFGWNNGMNLYQLCRIE